MNNLIEKFRDYCENRSWKFDNHSSEFTFQFRLCRFIEIQEPKNKIELESNINRYNIFNLIKKEIDIDILTSKNEKIALEIKYLRDKGSYNIGMYKFCEDIKFVEELIENGFDGGYAILFTTIQDIYTEPKRKLNPKNKENLILYESFRKKFKISNEISIKTGKMNTSLTLKGSYKLEWHDFNKDIKACLIKIEK